MSEGLQDQYLAFHRSSVQSELRTFELLDRDNRFEEEPHLFFVVAYCCIAGGVGSFHEVQQIFFWLNYQF